MADWASRGRQVKVNWGGPLGDPGVLWSVKALCASADTLTHTETSVKCKRVDGMGAVTFGVLPVTLT